MSTESLSDDDISSVSSDQRHVTLISNTLKMSRIGIESASTSDAIAGPSHFQPQIDVIPNDQPQAEIFKLKVDHFEELFDWLCLRDMISLGQTCRRMQRVVGHCIRTTYAAIEADLGMAGIAIRTRRGFIQLNGLSSFMKKFTSFVNEGYDSEKDEPYITEIIPRDAETERFKSITEISIIDCVLTNEELSRMKKVLHQCETVKLKKSNFVDDTKEFYASLLQYCTGVKKLCIDGDSSTAIIGTDNSWLLRKYPTLEHFALVTDKNGPVVELKTFFERNSNISSAAISEKMIVENRETLENSSTIKFDILSAQFRGADTFISSLQILNRLYERGFHKELHAYFPRHFKNFREFDQEMADQLSSLNGLTKLYIKGMKSEADVSHLFQLKELCILNPAETNLVTLDEKLFNLNCLHVMFAKWDDISPFILHSANLNKVILYGLKAKNSEKLVEDQKDDLPSDAHNLKKFEENVLNIEQLNKERSKLANARKVTIYVDDLVYLAVKWAKNRTDWSFIEIKRAAAYNTNHYFEYRKNPWGVI